MATTNGTNGHDDYRDIPDAKTIEEAGLLKVKDEDGKDIEFKSLYTPTSPNERILIIFLRHFFCGACELYIQSLLSTLPPNPSYKLLFIGPGSPSLIPSYLSRNSIPKGTLYADPTRHLYRALSFRSTSSPGSEGWRARNNSYHTKSFLGVVGSSMWNMLKSGPKAVGAGPPGQNGGAMVFEGGECVFVHRMRDVGDYLDREEARALLEGGKVGKVEGDPKTVDGEGATAEHGAEAKTEIVPS